jgi:hypothetical protein
VDCDCPHERVLLGSDCWSSAVGLRGILASCLCCQTTAKAQKDLIKNFCIDTVNNLKAIVDDMVDHRQRTQVIHGDYLSLLDVEINVFGRNRENIIHLPNPVRENIGKFVTDCAIRRAEIGTNLAQFVNLMTLADQLQSQGDGPQAHRVRNQTQVPLNRANQALDQLATRIKDSADLVNSLKQVR